MKKFLLFFSFLALGIGVGIFFYMKKKELIPLHKALYKANARLGDPIFIEIFKKEKLLKVWIKPKNSKYYKLLKSYQICAYSGKLGPKLKEGDFQAPEGFYKVYQKSLNPHSKYTLSFNLGFPNEYDRYYKRTGSYLMVHGKCVSSGCYAMGDRNIKEIYALVKAALKKGAPYVLVAAYPFEMTQKNLMLYQNNPNYPFWKNLQEGYTLFHTHKIPPIVTVKNGRYIFKLN